MTGTIGRELYAADIGSEARAHRLDDGFLPGPQRKETVAPGVAAQTGKHSCFCRREIAARDVEGLRQILQPFEIYSQRLSKAHPQNAAFAAMRKAEVGARGDRRRNQPGLA